MENERNNIPIESDEKSQDIDVFSAEETSALNLDNELTYRALEQNYVQEQTITQLDDEKSEDTDDDLKPLDSIDSEKKYHLEREWKINDDAEDDKRKSMTEINRWGQDLGDSSGNSSDLDNYPIKSKNHEDTMNLKTNLDEVDEAKGETESEDTNPITEEVAATVDEVALAFKDLISEKGNSLDKYISGKEFFNTISEILGVNIELCSLFAEVHKRGYCFNGVTAEDIVVNSEKKCKIANPNKLVKLNDTSYKVNYEKTCAPEILRNEARPNADSDKHTLSYLVFGLLFKSNPFEGMKTLDTVCYTKEDEIKMYENPVFVYDGEENKPLYGVHSALIKAWERVYPDEIKQLFLHNFIQGLKFPAFRLDIILFASTLSNVKAIVDSNIKKSDNVKPKKEVHTDDIANKNTKQGDSASEYKDNRISIDTDKSQTKPDPALNKYKLQVTYSIGNSINRMFIDLHTGQTIYNRLVGYDDLEENVPVGKVIENTKHRGLFGLKNLTNHKWIATEVNGEKKEILPGKVLIINKTKEVDFYPENKDRRKNEYKIEKQ